MSWPDEGKKRLLARLQTENWLTQARTEARYPCGCGLPHSQLEPEQSYRVWYLRGGRGAGKTRTGAETLAMWIRDWCFGPDLGDWAVIAPTFADARDTCLEGPSGLLQALGPLVTREQWNRSHGELFLPNGSRVYCDGANDGAYRIQGKNLRGAWADEVGLWEKPERAWDFSLQPAVRFDPGRIVATGTPKMAHPLIAMLIKSPQVVEHHMRMVDNEENLHPAAIEALQEAYGGSTLGRQELEGEFIEALEGSILNRMDWRWYDVDRSFYGREFTAEQARLWRFDRIVHTWDTALKDKTSADYASGQAWGCVGPDRYLLRLWHGHAGLNQTIAEMRELHTWTRSLWPRTPTYVLVENTANGPDAIAEMRRSIDGVTAIRAKGDKVQRALSAAVALETGHCHLPGVRDDLRGYTAQTPTSVQAFVEECAMFRGDMGHAHDDQVDAWSQMVNWARQNMRVKARIGRPSKPLPELRTGV